MNKDIVMSASEICVWKRESYKEKIFREDRAI